MVSYIVRRVFGALPVAFVITLITFFLIRLVPGDPAGVLLGPYATTADIEAMRIRLGLDRPVVMQYLQWLSGILRGDFGDSIFLGRSVLRAIAERLEPTLLLTALAISLAAVSGVVTGVISAWKRGTLLDHGLIVFSMIGLSIPNFWLGFMLSLTFAVNLGWFPVAGYEPLKSGLWNCLRHMVLPALALALQQSAAVARMTRSSVLEVNRLDYVRTAHAKGVRESVVLRRHVLRNSLIPIVTVIGLSTTVLLAGAIVVEMVFNIPGVGRLVIQAVSRRDYPVIQGVILMIGGIALAMNLLIDLLYGVIDPRVRYE